jgi:Family of unknown function (DUF6988)
MEQYVLDHYPNPTRTGCPDSQTLKLLVYEPLSLEFRDATFLHVMECAECMREVTRGKMRSLTMTSMDVRSEFEMRRAGQMHQFVADQLAGKYPDDDDRLTLFAAFLSLTQSHHEAILVLAGQERLIGSAFALFRPMAEVSYRGLFAAFLANDEQVEKIKSGGEPYGHFNELAAKLDTVFNTDGFFVQYAGQSWKMLNGYTHGGMEQLARRIDETGSLGAHFEPEEVHNLLSSSTSLLTRTAIPFLQVMRRDDAAHAVSMKYIELYPIPSRV